jgi:hypothetical protein
MAATHLGASRSDQNEQPSYSPSGELPGFSSGGPVRRTCGADEGSGAARVQ